jgi:hypothetical protein
MFKIDWKAKYISEWSIMVNLFIFAIVICTLALQNSNPFLISIFYLFQNLNKRKVTLLYYLDASATFYLSTFRLLSDSSTTSLIYLIFWSNNLYLSRRLPSYSLRTLFISSIKMAFCSVASINSFLFLSSSCLSLLSSSLFSLFSTLVFSAYFFR